MRLAEPRWALGVWAAPLAFVIAFLIARIALGVALVRLAKRVPAAAQTHAANRALGVVPGLANGLIDATIAAMLVLAAPLDDAMSRTAEESAIANRLAEPAEWLQAKLKPIFNPAIDRTLTRLTIHPESRDSIKLPFTVTNAKPRPDLEAAMLALVNNERAAQGLRPVEADPEAAQVARAHSIDMFARGYFSHLTPEGTTPFERMKAAGLRFRAAGENLALARTLPMAHQGLMNSPGHRANILERRFGRLGIGIVDGGRYGVMVTQNFRN